MDLDFDCVGTRPEAGGTLPPAAYTDPHVFEIEIERIFRHEWLALAHESQLANPGDYLTVDLFGDPLILVRGEDGSVRAFSNVCLHRSCVIAAGSGNAGSRLVCPYHRWSYGLDGRLRAAPHMQRAQGFTAADLRLPELAVERWQGLVFVNAAREPDPLTPRLEHLSALLEPQAVASWRIAHTSRWDSPWNWKVLVENFMESYHHMGPHRQTLDPLYPAAGTHPVSLPGHFALLENPPKDRAAPFWVVNVYPNTLLVIMRDDPAYGFWYQMYIDRHDHFDLDIHVLAPPELAANAKWAEGTAAAIREIHLEDVEVCNALWHGLASRYARPGRISHLEGCNWYFYDYLRNMLER